MTTTWDQTAAVADAQTGINRHLARMLPAIDFDAAPGYEVWWIDSSGRVFYIGIVLGWGEGNLMFGLRPPLGTVGLASGISVWGDWEKSTGFALDHAIIYTQVGPVDLPRDAGLLLADTLLQTLVDGQNGGLVYRLTPEDASVA